MQEAGQHPGLCTPHTRSDSRPRCDSQKVSRHCQRPRGGGQNHPDTTASGKARVLGPQGYSPLGTCSLPGALYSVGKFPNPPRSWMEAPTGLSLKMKRTPFSIQESAELGLQTVVAQRGDAEV